MATSQTNSDALGYYLSDPAGRGGLRSNREAQFLEFIVNNPIPPIITQRVSPANGAGTGTIRAASTTTLAYTAPGDTEGTPVTVTANTSTLLESDDPTKSVRVYRDSVYSADSLGGTMTLDLVPGFNNAIGMDNITVAGATTYGFVWLVNHSAQTISNVTITPGTGYTVVLESPTSGAVQTIADSSTAPSAVSFVSSESITTLPAGEMRGLWIKRAVGATTVNAEATGTITIAYDYDGDTYTDVLTGRYRIADTSLERYEIHIGVDTAPDFTTADSTSATLPMSDGLTNSAVNYYAVRKRNKYNLVSFNTLTGFTELDGSGNDITNVLTNPQVVSTTSMPGGEVDVVLRYPGATDAMPATHFRLYTTTTGINPNTGTDTPVNYPIEVQGLGIPTVTQRITLGPYAYGTDLRFIARMYESTTPLESDSATVTTHTVTTQDPVMVNWAMVTSGLARGHGARAYDSTTTYGDASIRIVTGETVLSGSAEAFRALLGNYSRLRTTFDFVNVAHSAAGTSTPIEAVSATEIYINVAGTRRCKIDITAGTIEAAAFEFLETAISLPVIGPTYTTTAATYIMIFNAITGRWMPCVMIEADGTFTATSAIWQE